MFFCFEFKEYVFFHVLFSRDKKTTRFHKIATTLFLFHKKKTCAKRKTMELFLVKVFTKPLQGLRGRGAEPHIGKKVVGKAFLSKKRFLVKILVILWLFFGMTIVFF